MGEAGSGLVRRLVWDACYNVRDLGGYPTEDGGQTRWRAILRADNLCRLTPAGSQALVAYGVRTIIDLRNPREVAMDPNPFAGMEAGDGTPACRHLPFEDETDAVSRAMVDAAESVPAMYGILLDRYQGRIGAIIAAIAAAPDGGVLVHCHAGKDRTGLVVALLLALTGVSHQTIAEDYALSDTYLQPLYDDWLSSIGEPAERERQARRYATPVENMLAVLAALETRHHGVRAYLRAGGVSDRNIERIRARLRDERTLVDEDTRTTG